MLYILLVISLLVIIYVENGRKQGKKGKKFPRFADGQPSANMANLAPRTTDFPMAVAFGKLTITLPMARAIGKKIQKILFKTN